MDKYKPSATWTGTRVLMCDPFIHCNKFPLKEIIKWLLRPSQRSAQKSHSIQMAIKNDPTVKMTLGVNWGKMTEYNSYEIRNSE